MNDRGVALLAVLWILTIVAAVAGVALADVRTGLGAAVHRAEAVRGRWHAEGCLAHTRAALDRALRADRIIAWRGPVAGAPPHCPMHVTQPDSGRRDVNLLALDQLRGLPGFTDHLAARVVEDRAMGVRIRGIADLLAIADPLGRRALMDSASAFGETVAYEPEAWVVTAGGRVQEVWVRAGARTAVVGRVLK